MKRLYGNRPSVLEENDGVGGERGVGGAACSVCVGDDGVDDVKKAKGLSDVMLWRRRLLSHHKRESPN